MESISTIAKMIDHSLLHPTMTDKDLAAGCQVALRCDVASACVKPYAVHLATDILKGSSVAVCSVIGFPHGNSHIEIKVLETERAIAEGATEIDMVINIGKALGQDWEYISREIKLINAACTARNAILKVIFETDYLTDDVSKTRLCQISSEHAVAFVKTSTGYGFTRRDNGMYAYTGATDHDLALMRKECAPSVQIKASGGVRTLDDLLRVRSLGVNRIGATATEAILAEARKRGYE